MNLNTQYKMGEEVSDVTVGVKEVRGEEGRRRVDG